MRSYQGGQHAVSKQVHLLIDSSCLLDRRGVLSDVYVRQTRKMLKRNEACIQLVVQSVFMRRKQLDFEMNQRTTG